MAKQKKTSKLTLFLEIGLLIGGVLLAFFAKNKKTNQKNSKAVKKTSRRKK